MNRRVPATAGGAALETTRVDRLRRWSIALVITTLFTLVTACDRPPAGETECNFTSGSYDPARSC